MKKTLLLILFSIVFLVIAGFFIFDNNASAPKTEGIDSTRDSSKNLAPTTKLTVDEISKHASKQDCWTIIESAVYDITAYIPRHPGGEEILKACGTDGAALFRGNDPDGRSGGHSGSAESQLSSLKIGDLK